MTQVKHYLLIAVGSAGDVHPFVGIGLTLKARGHRVSIATSAYFQEMVERSGLDFIETNSKEEFIENLNDPDIWKPGPRSLKKIAQLCEQGIAPIYQIIEDQQSDDLVVVSSILAFGARNAQDKLGVKHITVHLAPCVYLSAIQMPKLPGLSVPGWLPIWSKRLLIGLIDWIADRIYTPSINRHRKTLGLPKAKQIVTRWWHSPTAIVNAFPAWYGEPQKDWPSQQVSAGFPLFDEANLQASLAPKLQDFLEKHPKPIAFTPGSANVHGKPFFEAAVEACNALNRPGLLLTKFPEGQIPDKLPEHVMHVDYAPFSVLLPHCAGLVHHGGIGTLSQALQAGIPQLITHMAHDQPDNAYRITQLKLGEQIKYQKLTAKKLTQKLNAILDNPEVQTSCEAATQRIAERSGLEAICDQIIAKS